MSLPLAFLNPWMLAALIVLPALWFLLRLVPPRPKRVDFPPTRLLFDIEQPRQTPARTPWWLVLLRLGLAALIIAALARPIWNPAPVALRGAGPLLVVVDNGWAAAPDWQARIGAVEQVIASAEEAGRPVALLPTAAAARGPIETNTPDVAREKLRILQPEPVVPDRDSLIQAIRQAAAADPLTEIVWFSDGLGLGAARDFADALKVGDRPPTVYLNERQPALGLAAAANSASALTVRVLRSAARGTDPVSVRAMDLRGRPLAETRASFGDGETTAEARFDLPVELRNDVARLEIPGENSAAAVQLLDGRWKRRAVGLVTGTTADTALPLLAPIYYLSRALAPFADVRRPVAAGQSGIIEMLDQKVPVLVLADVGAIVPDVRQRLSDWVRKGGVLVRFAGARLAATGDDLVPVHLRRGGRVLGGALAWETPQALGGFSSEGPFAGLTVPTDVTVTRQVLAEPDATLAERTWASLADGTPLVTGASEGQGMQVLFHVTADTTWSNLPLSGSFVDMLRKIVGLAGTGGQAPAETASPRESAETVAMVPPSRVLDGFGAFRSPPATARPIPVTGAVATLATPPGFYGPPDGLVAVNTLADDAELPALSLAGLAAEVRTLTVSDPLALAPWLLTAAVLFGVLDTFVVFFLAGGFGLLQGRLRRGAAASLLLTAGVLAGSMISGDARAQEPSAADKAALEATLATRLAYVITGNAEIDAASKAGLEGLTLALASRTALEPGGPMGVDPAKDELAFFPLLYWPIDPAAQEPSGETLARIDSYMKQGGTVLFDSRDALYGTTNQGPGAQALRQLLGRMDIPELESVPGDHVLTKAFYLLRDFPGRFADGPLWVEAMPAAEGDAEDRPARPGDGVSPILITSNDFAGAWAIGADGAPLYPTQPTDPRQRELAYRVGINIVMYTLTGNYKADQVHVPALLERLGQ